MRLLQLIAAALLGVSIAFAPAAHAKKDKSKDGDYTKIEMTGIKSVDDLFKEVRAIQKNLSAVEKSINGTTSSLTTTLGLAKDTPLNTALTDLKNKADGKLQVAMNGTTPHLSTTDAVPANVQEAIDAVNSGIADVTSSIAGLKELPTQIKSIQDKATKLDPAKIKDEAGKSGLGLGDTLSAVKIVGSNLKATSQTAGRANDTKDAAFNFMDAFTGSFGEATPGAGSGGSNGATSGGTRGGTRGGSTGNASGNTGGNGSKGATGGSSGKGATDDKGGTSGGGGRTRGGGNR